MSMKDRPFKEDIVWCDAENVSLTSSSFHGYYGRKRQGGIEKITSEYHEGNSALCNKNFGICEDMEKFVPISEVPKHEFNEKLVCKKCLKIYNNLNNQTK